jgi:drug/metabolite transporter (DMT)-like permease
MQQIQSLVRNYGVLVFLGVVWGSSFILMKKGALGFESTQMAAMRMTIAGICVWPFFFFVQKPKVLRDWLWLGLAGTVGNLIPAFLFAISIKYMASSLQGVFNSLTPMFTLLMGVIFFGVGFTFSKLTGVILGLAGSLLLIISKSIDAQMNYTIPSALMLILAALLYGTNANIIK